MTGRWESTSDSPTAGGIVAVEVFAGRVVGCMKMTESTCAVGEVGRSWTARGMHCRCRRRWDFGLVGRRVNLFCMGLERWHRSCKLGLVREKSGRGKVLSVLGLCREMALFHGILNQEQVCSPVLEIRD